MKGYLIMKESELLRIEVLEKLQKRKIKQKSGAKILRISIRQIRRVLKKYKFQAFS